MVFHNCSCKVGPSLLACDMSDMANEAKRVVDAGADYLHLDVMDGHFVPNITFGAPVIKCLRRHTKAFFDCHMMVSKPEQWVQDIADAGGDQFTFHFESTENPEALIQQIKDAGMKVGVAVKPNTDIKLIDSIVDKCDMVLIMTVEPGFGGQSFMPDMMDKVEYLRSSKPEMDIGLDGGLGPKTIDVAAKAGANMIVAGSAVFNSDPREVIQIIRDSVEKYGNGKGQTSA